MTGRSSARELIDKKKRAPRQKDLPGSRTVFKLTDAEKKYNAWYAKNSKPTVWVDVYQEGEYWTTLKLKQERWEDIHKELVHGERELLEHPIPGNWAVGSWRVRDEGVEQIWTYHFQESWDDKCCYGKCEVTNK